jgi:hypothetical protein
MSSYPFLAQTPEEAEALWWDDFCVMNLAKFIPVKRNQKIAVIAKGCDARNLIVHHLEKQNQSQGRSPCFRHLLPRNDRRRKGAAVCRRCGRRPGSPGVREKRLQSPV